METIWILVHVKRGFIQEPEIFFSEIEAKNRETNLKADFFNKDYDEIEIFEKQVTINKYN